MQLRVLAMIMAGGRGSRLSPLTRDRAKPAVPFGGKYRIIDFALSNFVNSGIHPIYVLTQFMCEPLRSTCRRLAPVAFLGPLHQVRAGADADRRDLVPGHRRRDLPEPQPRPRVAAAPRLHLRRRPHLQDGRQPDDRVPRAARGRLHGRRRSRCRSRRRRAFGVIEVDDEWRDRRLPREAREPASRSPAIRAWRSPRWATTSSRAGRCSRRSRPTRRRRRARTTSARTSSRRWSGTAGSSATTSGQPRPRRERARTLYWRDVGTIEAYFDANMDLRDVVPAFNLYNRHWPIRTARYDDPPAKFVHEDASAPAARSTRWSARARSSPAAPSATRSSAGTSRSIRSPRSPTRSSSTTSRSARTRRSSARSSTRT